jgi:hypothetical protein
MDDRTRRVVEAWPALTPEQKARVRFLLTTGGPVPDTRSALDEAMENAR